MQMLLQHIVYNCFVFLWLKITHWAYGSSSYVYFPFPLGS